MSNDEYFCRIKGPTVVGGLVLNFNFIVVDTAPVFKYMKGWPYKKVVLYCQKRGWKLERLS